MVDAMVPGTPREGIPMSVTVSVEGLVLIFVLGMILGIILALQAGRPVIMH